MSNKLKYIIFFGAVFGLLGFAHSIRCSEAPIISSLVGWLTICTALYYFTVEAFPTVGYGSLRGDSIRGYLWRDIKYNDSTPLIIGALAFSALQHAFILIDRYYIESIFAALFFVWFYFVLGKAVDG